MMNGQKNRWENFRQALSPLPQRAGRLLGGLRRQREELGASADELIELVGHRGAAKDTPQSGRQEGWPDEVGQCKDD